MEEPALLPVGTEVSAKYRGAFCEAKVKKLVKVIKLKVTLKESGLPMIIVACSDEDVKGILKVGSSVDVKHPESGQYVAATIGKITDQSSYTVVFDDGDENTLRRSQLCLKGEKHFVKTETLDELPLTNPEQFGTPVLKGSKKKRRSMTTAVSSESDSGEESDEPESRHYWGRLKEMVGKVVCFQQEDRKKTMTIPALVSQADADETELKTKDHLLVKSFKDSKFYSVHKKDAKEFTRDIAMKNDDKALKAVYEKALLYFDAKELPQHWDKEDLLGPESDSEEEDDQSSDNEPSEEKDMIVALLYKFMDDRATPINKEPVIGTRELNLYRLFMVVHKLGGYNRVTNEMKWRLVYSKMGLPNTGNAANQMKTAYKKYLHAFEDFYRKLGNSMGTITRPNRSRMSTSRNIPGFRDRGDKGDGSPRSPRGGGLFVAKKVVVKEEPLLEVPEVEVSEGTVEIILLEDNPSKTPQESKVYKSKSGEEPGRSSKAVEEPSDGESPGKRRTRTAVEERTRVVVNKEVKKTVKEEEEGSEKEEVKVKKRPIRKKLTKTEEAERDEVKKPTKEEGKEDADDEEEEEEEDDDEEDAKSTKTTGSDDLNSAKKYENVEYPPGSKLKIKYGKGKNVKAYEAKVLDCKFDMGIMHYLVHYNGWNVRYDEWVKKDRILDCVHKADGKRPLTSNKPILPLPAKPILPAAKPILPPAKPILPAVKPILPVSKVLPVKKKILPSKPVGTSVKDDKEKLSKSTSPKMSKLSKAPRPTRSTSLENQLAHGLSPRKRLRSGYTETEEKSLMSDESSGSGEEDDDEEDHPMADDNPSLPRLSLMEEDDDQETDPRESAFDIMKELQADIEFDKASQDSLQRDLNIKMPDKTKQEKSDSEENMDINSILSCLKDEYKYPSSGSESVKSEGPEKRMVRGKTKTKGELKARPDLSKIQKPEVLKARAETKPKVETPKPKAESSKGGSPEQPKIKAEPFRAKVEFSKARVDLSRTKIDPGVAKAKSESVVNRKEPIKSKTELTAAKTKQESVKNKALDNESSTTEKGSVSEKEERAFSPVETPDLSRSTDSDKAKTEKASSSGDEQVSAPERPKGRKKKEPEEEKSDKNESPSKLRGKGRGKRRFDKDETPDSEEEPIKKKTRKKPKRQTESESDEKSVPPKLSTVCSDDGAAKEDTEKQEENEWMNAPELTATPKLELEVVDDKDCDIADQPAPSLSPVHLRSTTTTAALSGGGPSEAFIEQDSKVVPEEDVKEVEQADEEGEDEEVEDEEEEEIVPLPKAFTSTVENTPPQTPEPASADNTPRHDNVSEACSTRSELEANMEVEGYLVGALPPGEDSPTGAYDPSNLSTASDESLNQDRLGEVEASVAASLGMQALVKRKAEEIAAVTQQVVAQKRRRGSKKSGGQKIKQHVEGISLRRNIGDYDDEDSKDAIGTSKSSIMANLCSFPALSKPIEYPTGPTKYNFIEQLEEGKYLTGESRVNFLLGKISDLRSIYLQLKNEVASIDRRRKKFRKKQRIAQETAAQGLIGLEQSVS